MTGDFNFQDPWILGLWLLLPLLAWHRHRTANFGAILFSGSPTFAGGSWRIHLSFYIRLLALAVLIAAAARPQLGFAREESLTQGIDIQVVLDVSGSMAAEDFQPRNRLAVAKDVMKEFVSKRTADRVGIVIFAGNAMTKAPLTTDRTMLTMLLDSIELNSLPDGTAIGMALANAAARLKESDATTKIIVLVTDGVNNRGAIDPDSAAAVCEGLGIKVYTIGVGTGGEVPVPVPYRDLRGQIRTRTVRVEVEIDEELLQNIAERTGGKYFKATDPESLRMIFDEIDELEKTPLEVKRYIRYQENFQPLLWTALGLLVMPILLALAGVTTEP